MATMSSMGLKVASSPNAILDKSQFTGSFESPRVARFNRQLNVRAQLQQDEAPTQSRRAMFGVLLAAAGVLAVDQESRALSDIKINGPPPPSGGLPGTENADQPRDLDLPLKDRSFLQPVTPAEAVNRIKDASKDIVGVKELIEKKSWPYVRNDLRSKATYLRYDLTTILSSKSKEERKEIKKLTSKLFDVMDKLDFAARMKDPKAAEQSYNDTVAALDDVIAKISA